MPTVMLYALSTCGWCRKTKAFFVQHNVPYDHIDVDLLQGADKERVMVEVRRWNPRASFPTIVLDGRLAIVGFDEEQLRRELGL